MGKIGAMRRCAFLTMADPTGYVIDDHLAVEPLRSLGWSVDILPWQRRGVAWGDYDLVVIRSTWDYYDAPDAFLRVLDEIDRSAARLENPLELVRWNLSKTYLRDLAERGVPIVPTLFRERLEPGDAERLFDEAGQDEIVVKPVVGASGIGAFRLDRASFREKQREVEAYFASRALMVQPFVPAILGDGEHSLFYFNGRYSHAIVKTPADGEFRSQEEHGARVLPVTASDALREAGRRALGALDRTPLYARLDFVRSGVEVNRGEELWLMEMELTEPSMYLRMDAAAPERFARALNA